MRGRRKERSAPIAFPKLFAQLGLIPADTEFNRRAAVYARDAAKIVGGREYAARYRAAKKASRFPG